ncbi:MAG: tRNA pseudouridine(55) synthase TruB [Bacteroidota bacterium]|nr:tRNA pseudouridine(55) synthase TruB [Bacteroidota bacterium]
MSQGLNTIEQFRAPAGGVLLVDKPRGWTSFDVVKKVRGTLRVRKVGHAGTLDPMATGLLILCSGPMTKSIDTFQALVKRYEGSMRLGAVTPSYDAETPEEQHRPVGDVDLDDVRRAAQQYTGDIEQLPPMYSAVKVDGKRLYALARKGREVERKPRVVHVERFDITDVAVPDVEFRVTCSKGTYVRTLAHDLGQDLGCGAYLTALRRTAIGSFLADEAWSIDAIVTEALAIGISLPGKENADAGRQES